MRRTVPLLPLVLLAGCGGGNEPSFGARAEAACEGTPRPREEARTLTGLARVAARREASSRALAEALTRLDPPASAAPLLAAVRADAALSGRLVLAARSGDLKAVERLATEGVAIERRVTGAARRAGAPRCGDR